MAPPVPEVLLALHSSVDPAVRHMSCEIGDLTSICWHHPGWLASYPLRADTVLDYFANSDFFDNNCLNVEAGRRNMPLSMLHTLAPGVEYVLEHAQEDQGLYVIRRHYRAAVNEKFPQPQAFYYVVKGIVYQAPTLHSLLNSNLANCLHLLKAAFGKMQEDLDPLFRSEKAAELQRRTGRKPEEAPPVPTGGRLGQQDFDWARKVDGLLVSVMGSHPPPGLLPTADPVQEASLQLNRSGATPANRPQAMAAKGAAAGAPAATGTPSRSQQQGSKGGTESVASQRQGSTEETGAGAAHRSQGSRITTSSRPPGSSGGESTGKRLNLKIRIGSSSKDGQAAKRAKPTG